MKKIVLGLVLLLAVQGAQAQDCSTLKCPAPYDLTSGFSRGMSTVTGQKFLSEKIGEKLVKKAIKKNIVSGDIKADLDAYSVRDLKAGRFKSLEVSGKNVDIQGIYVSSFNAKTLCNFNYIANDKRGNYIVKEDIPVSFNAVVTEEDLNKTMNSSDYKRMIDDINSIGGNFNIFQITSTNIKLKNNKMYYEGTTKGSQLTMACGSSHVLWKNNDLIKELSWQKDIKEMMAEISVSVECEQGTTVPHIRPEHGGVRSAECR